MRNRTACLVALGMLLAFALQGRGAVPTAEAAGDDGGGFVAVQFRTLDTLDLASQFTPGGARSGTPTLEEKGYRTLRVPPGMTTASYVAWLRSQPNVISAMPDVPVYATAAPNDPLYAANQASYLSLLGLPAAWDVATGSKGIVVAVLDTGTDLGHEELASRLWRNDGEIPGDGIDNDKNGCVDDLYGCRFVSVTPARRATCGYTSDLASGDVADDHGKPDSIQHSHGTMVAGALGAAGNNGAGVAGIAWDVRIMTVKVLDCGTGPGGEASGDLTDVAKGIEYARRMGADIILLSLTTATNGPEYDLPAMREAIQAAQDQGIIIVAAAGNHSASNPGYPAAYTQFPSLIGVGAADNENGMQWASFSDYGPGLDFAAPGVHIASTTRTSFGAYGSFSGTSFAAPLVAGMFALMESRNSKLDPADYIQIARETATPAQPNPKGGNWAGAGIINIGAAVARVPMSISGAALRDWKDVPTGTEVKATIGGKDCGVTRSTTLAGVARFTLKVDAAGTTLGCGAPGKVVKVSIGGFDAPTTLLWGGRNEDIGIANRDVVGVSPAPGPIVVQTLNGGWSNVAHLEAPGKLPQALSYLPQAWTTALKWDPAKPGPAGLGGFTMSVKNAPAFVSDWPDLPTYEAYWVDAPAANVASLNPNPPAGRVVNLKPGWNNFVYTGDNKQVSDALAGIAGKYTQVLSYDNATKTWQFYTPGQPRYVNDFGGLFKLKVYWIFVSEPVAITF